MAKYSKKQKVSEETELEAMRIARGTQRPGQTKEQTKLIAQGIQKGIDAYKKEQKAKARELDKRLKKLTHQVASPQSPDNESSVAPSIARTISYKQPWLPWLLLLFSWLGILGYQLLSFPIV
jgi:hypothetical protein